MRKAVLALGAAFAAILAYGYWHASTHATLSLSLLDARPGSGATGLAAVEMRLLDASGSQLALARSHGAYRVVSIVAPAAYSCVGLEEAAVASLAARDAWGECFQRQSRWIAQWANRIAAVDLRVGECRLPGVPVSTRVYGEWWLWWVPLPHVGGRPYTHHSLWLSIDPVRCTVARHS
jgi:hypothetical protein